MEKEIKKGTTIQHLPEGERPYEKCECMGCEALSDVELLAIILQSGTKGRSSLELARDIIYHNGEKSSLADIHQWNMQQLRGIKGIGRVKSLQILCICELGKRLSKADAKKGLAFNNPKSIVNFFKEEMRHLRQEHMKLILVDTKSQLMRESTISIGTINSTAISPRELLVEALKIGAVGMILIHNHPSGDPSPSLEDIQFTKRMKMAGDLVGVELLDHIIIGNNAYISFNESGQLKT